jgi:hypothetical protein
VTFVSPFILLFGRSLDRHCEEQSDEAIRFGARRIFGLDCFAEFIIGRRFAPTRWLAMTKWVM